MMKLLRSLLELMLNNIDSGNSKISENELEQLIDLIQKITSGELSKIESANYIGVSRATFDNYIKKGLIPEGKKYQGRSNLLWKKSDLDSYINTKQSLKNF